MTSQEDDDFEIARSRNRWHIKLAVACFVVAYLVGSHQQGVAQTEWDKVEGWWAHVGMQNPKLVLSQWLGLGFMCACVMFFPARALARNEVRDRRAAEKANAQAKLEAAMQAEADEQERMESEQNVRDERSHATRSVEQVILLLGNIDQFIRVLTKEEDTTRRTVALQSAQSAVASIESKAASGELDRSALRSPEVKAHAAETLRDLNRIGLSDDRLFRDLLRLFGFAVRARRIAPPAAQELQRSSTEALRAPPDLPEASQPTRNDNPAFGSVIDSLGIMHSSTHAVVESQRPAAPSDTSTVQIPASGLSEPLPVEDHNSSPSVTHEAAEEPLPTDPAVQLRLWNPSAAANWSAVFFPVGAFLHAANWRALGEPERAATNTLWAIVISLACILIGLGSVLTGGNWSWFDSLVVAFALLATWYFSQGKAHIRHVSDSVGQDYGRKDWETPLFAAAACNGLIILLAVSTSIVPPRFVEEATEASILNHWKTDAARKQTTIPDISLIHQDGSRYVGYVDLEGIDEVTVRCDLSVTFEDDHLEWKITPPGK